MAKKKNCMPEFKGKKFELVDYNITPNVLGCNNLEQYATLNYTYTVSEVNNETCEVETKTYHGIVDGVLLSCKKDDKAPTESITLSDTVFVNLAAEDGETFRTGITFMFNCEGCSGKCDEDVEFRIAEINLDRWSFDCEGGETPRIVKYIITRIDKDCNKTFEYGEYTCQEPLIVNPCKGEDCCKDHYLSYAVILRYNKKTGEVSECDTPTEPTDEYLYSEIGYPILIVGDKQNKCGNDCKCEPVSGEVTYCVDKESVRVLYLNEEENVLYENGIVPLSGGTVIVSFDFDWYTTETDCDGNTKEITGRDSYVDEVEIPACNCDDGECGNIVVETEFKTPYAKGCNEFSYEIRQETCLNK